MPPLTRPPASPDAELLLINWLNNRPEFAVIDEDVIFANDIPYFQGLAANTAYGRITRVAGETVRFVSAPIVDLDIFSMSYDLTVKVSLLAENLLLYGLFGTKQPEGGVCHVREIIGPHWIPDENQDLTRYSATYEVRAR